jgi:hypothetical protein
VSHVTYLMKFLFHQVAEGGVTFQKFHQAVGQFFHKYVDIKIEAAISGGDTKNLIFHLKFFKRHTFAFS